MIGRDDLPRAWRSTSITFVLHAAVAGTWAPRVPALKAQTGITNGELGLALFVMAAGLLAGTRSASSMVDRYGSRPVLRVGIPLLCAALMAPALAHSLLALSGGFVALGCAAGLLDVAMNAQGVAVERRFGRPILNGLHGLWCVGLGLGAAAAAVAAAADLTPVEQFAAVGGLIAGISLPGLAGLLPDRPPSHAVARRAADSQSLRRSPAVPTVLMIRQPPVNVPSEIAVAEAITKTCEGGVNCGPGSPPLVGTRGRSPGHDSPVTCRP